MKDKYAFLLSLKSLAYEIEELNEYSRACSDCYELLKNKLDLLCRFMTSDDNERQWSLWQDHDEIRVHSASLREAAVQALCSFEKHQSLRTSQRLLNIGDYLSALSGTVREELELVGITSASRVLFVGSGAFPLSALTIAQETGAEVLGLDIDEEAVQLGRQAAAASGLEAQVQFTSSPLREVDFLRGASHVVIASLVQDKRDVVEGVKDMIHDNARVLLRYGNGLKSVFNYPLEHDLSAEWKQTRIVRSKSLYDALILEPRKVKQK